MGGHLLAEAYKFVEPSGDLVAEPGLFLLPGVLGGERSGQTCSVTGIQISQLFEETELIWCVYQGGDFLKESGEFATPGNEMAVERFIVQQKVLLCTPHLHEKDLEQAFFCCNARGVCSQNRGAQASKLVQLHERKEAHGQQQDDERDLCQDNPPENGQPHSSLLRPALIVEQLMDCYKHFSKNIVPLQRYSLQDFMRDKRFDLAHY